MHTTHIKYGLRQDVDQSIKKWMLAVFFLYIIAYFIAFFELVDLSSTVAKEAWALRLARDEIDDCALTHQKLSVERIRGLSKNTKNKNSQLARSRDEKRIRLRTTNFTETDASLRAALRSRSVKEVVCEHRRI